MNYKDLFEQIDTVRKEKGLNPSALCRKADLSQMAWRNLKEPVAGINTSTLVKFAKTLNIDEITLKMR